MKAEKQYRFSNGAIIKPKLKPTGETAQAMGETVIFEARVFDIYFCDKLVAENIQTWEEAIYEVKTQTRKNDGN